MKTWTPEKEAAVRRALARLRPAKSRAEVEAEAIERILRDGFEEPPEFLNYTVGAE